MITKKHQSDYKNFQNNEISLSHNAWSFNINKKKFLFNKNKSFIKYFNVGSECYICISAFLKNEDGTSEDFDKISNHYILNSPFNKTPSYKVINTFDDEIKKKDLYIFKNKKFIVSVVFMQNETTYKISFALTYDMVINNSFDFDFLIHIKSVNNFPEYINELFTNVELFTNIIKLSFYGDINTNNFFKGVYYYFFNVRMHNTNHDITSDSFMIKKFVSSINHFNAFVNNCKDIKCLTSRN